MSQQQEELLQAESILIHTKWKPFLITQYPIFSKAGRHRNDIKDISSISTIKSELKKKLHPLVVREFLKLYATIASPTSGAYRNSEKAMLILYQLLTGKSDHKMFINQTTYSKISRKFWCEGNLERINNWSEKWMKRFSNNIVRLLHARVFNPPRLNNITLIIDGKDIATNLYRCAKERRVSSGGKSSLTCWKLNYKNAARQQLMMDVRGMTVAISHSSGANEVYDGHQMTTMFDSWGEKIKELFNPETDVLLYDHHFTSEAKKFVKDNEDLGYSSKNITNPIINFQRTIPR